MNSSLLSQRSLPRLCLLSAFALLGCSASPPAEEARDPAASASATESPGASPQATAPAVRPALAYTSGPEVLKAFPLETQRILRDAGEVEVLGLICERGPAPQEPRLRHYPITARTVVSGQRRDALLRQVYRGVAEGQSLAMCFEPHHALRATHQGRTVEVVICFECTQLYVYDGRQEPGFAAISTAAEQILEQLLGVDRSRDSRAVGGRPLHEWIEVFSEGPAPGERSGLSADEAAAAAGLAEAMAWAGRSFAEQAGDALRCLGPLAKPALPGLLEALRAPDPFLVLQAAGVCETLGPEAGPAALELARAYERDYSAYLMPAEDTSEEDDEEDDPKLVSADLVQDLRYELLNRLIQLGRAAAPARAQAERWAASENPTVAEAGREILVNTR